MNWKRFILSVVAMAAIGAVTTPLASALNMLSQDAEMLIRVRKSTREMWLQRGDQVLRHFKIVLGPAPSGGKLYRGDGRTPVGRYYVSDKNPNSRWHRFLGISYPNIADAERAFDQKLISDNEWTDIFFANLKEATPPQNTLMGGRVGIHGYGGLPELPVDWTEGCIAVSDTDIEFLYNTVPVGTAIEITD